MIRTSRGLAWLVVVITVSSVAAAFLTVPVLGMATSQTSSIDVEMMIECSSTDIAMLEPLGSGSPPMFIGSSPGATITVSHNVSKVISCGVLDSDGDNVNVTWDFGDGTPTVTNLTGPATVSQTVYVEHSWTPSIEQGVGGGYLTFTLNITIDDGNGNYAWRTATVYCYLPENYGPQSDIDTQYLAFVNDIVNITAMANDSEGEPLTWTFVFNDSTSDFLTLVYHTPATEPSVWQWNNITYSFSVEGNYTVTLHVSDALGINQTGLHNTSDTAFITVPYNRPPYNTHISNDPESPLVSGVSDYVDVSFVIEVYDAEGDIVTAVWDFDDGSAPEIDATPGGPFVYQLSQVHRFVGPGEFNVTVTMTDGRPGNEVVEYRVITIVSTNLPPNIVLFSHLAFGPPWDPFVFSGTQVSYEVTLTDAEEDNVAMVWDFGDGSPYSYLNLTDYVEGNTSGSVIHSYADAGVYTLVIRYTDNQVGSSNHTPLYSITVRVETDDTLPVADAGEDHVVQAPSTVQFDGSGSTDDWAIANYSWSFEYNGSLVELWGVYPTFEFFALGTYIVILNVTDYAGNHNTSQVVVEVVELIPEYPVALPAAVLLVLVPALHYVWRRKRSQ